MYSIITPLKNNQLFNPFYKTVPFILSEINLPVPSPTPESKEIFKIFSMELNNNPFDFYKKSNRRIFYENNRYKPNILVRRRAYEFAYTEFKKAIRATIGNSAGPHISTSPGGGVPSYQDITKQYNAPWCASFTAWCYYQAGFKDLKNASGLALAMNWGQRGLVGKRQLRVISPKQVSAGDLVVWGLETTDYENDHVGFFSKWLIKPWQNGGIGLFTTIEGNTGPDREVKVNSSGNISFGEAAAGPRGVYGKKHTYNMKDASDQILKGKTVTFGRIFAE